MFLMIFGAKEIPHYPSFYKAKTNVSICYSIMIDLNKNNVYI